MCGTFQQHECGSNVERHVIGYRRQPPSGHAGEVCVAAAAQAVSNPLARLHAIHIRAKLFDNTGSLHTQRDGQRRPVSRRVLVYAFAHIDVDEVDARELDTYQHFTCLRLGYRRIRDHQLLRPTVFVHL